MHDKLLPFLILLDAITAIFATGNLIILLNQSIPIDTIACFGISLVASWLSVAFVFSIVAYLEGESMRIDLLKQPHIKDINYFNKVAQEYSFEKRDVGEIYQRWEKRVGNISIEIYDHHPYLLHFTKKYTTFYPNKKTAEKYLKDILHLIEWR